MKYAAAVILIFCLVVPMTGCGAIQAGASDIDSVRTYRDIPGVTEEEIEAVEALKASRGSFLYGSVISAEFFMQEDGTYAGFTVAFCELLTQLFDIPFVHVLDNWDAMKSGVDDKSIDFTGELTFTPARLRNYYMTNAIAERSLRIFTLANAPDIDSEIDVNGLKLGFFEGTVTRESLSQYYPDLAFETVEVSSVERAAAALLEGEVDVMVNDGHADPAFEQYDFIVSKEFFPLVYNPVSLATSNPELSSVISVVDKYLTAGGIDKLYAMHAEGEHQYARYKLSRSFTDEEKAFLYDLAERNAKVRIALEYDNYPSSFFNEKEKAFQGIAPDVLAAISALTDIEFEVATEKDEPWAQILEKLRAGEVSLVSQLLYSEGRKDSFLWSEVPYISSHYAMISKMDYPNLAAYQVIRARVGIVRKTAHEDLYNMWYPNSSNARYYDTQIEALEALERDEIDLLMASENRLLTQTHYREKPGYKINILFTAPMLDSFFGFNKNERVLCSIVNKTQTFINTDAIASEWTGRVFDYSRKYAVQLSWYLSGFSVILLLVLMLIIYLWQANRRVRRELVRETAKLSAIFSTIPDMLYSKDANCRYTGCNPSFEAIAGMSEADIIGKNAMEVFPAQPDLARRFVEEDETVIRDCVMLKVEEWNTYPDGRRRLFETVKAPLIQDGKVTGLMGLSRDITQHKEAEEAAQAASSAKSSFLTHMSHEIRTPMNAIAGMAELIMREEIPHAIYQHVLGIRHASANLLSLINDILDYSKIETGELEIVSSEYLFTSLMNDVLVIIRMRVSEKPILFTANIDSGIPNSLIGDEARLRQILLNILGNAAQYTREGFITLAVKGAIEGDTVRLTFEVSDSGIGIRREDYERLFEHFVRFDNAQNKDIHGAGLGLAITKRLCQAMGGGISARSEYGKGSTFTVTIPQHIGAHGDTFAQVPNPEDKRVLLYETRPLYAQSIADTLDDLRVPYTVVSDHKEFSEALKSGAWPFVLLSSKLYESVGGGMEEMDRSATAVLLMEFGETPSVRNVRTIALPAHAASIANILNDTEDHMRYNEGGQNAVRFVAPTASVLVVDDLNTNLKVAEGLMAPYQMQVDVCASGAEAVRYARLKRYDIIFMDHMMPDMDGIEATRLIRALEDGGGYYENVPIIALTANAVSGVKGMFLESGMNDFLSKPIDIAKLDSVLGRWIPKDKRERFSGVGHSGPADADTTDIRIEGIDVQAGITLTGGTAENYLKTLAIFHLDGLDKLIKIRDCAENGNLKLFITYVHGIKSAAATIGAGDLSEMAKALELAGIREDAAYIRGHTEDFLYALEARLRLISAALENERNRGSAHAEHNPERIAEQLLRLKEALNNMDAGEVNDAMRALNTVGWKGADGEIYSRIAAHVLRFNYDEASVLAEQMMKAGYAV